MASPSSHRPRQEFLNQDVRDDVCEFAVSTVSTACALRRVCRGFRFGADRRVRELIARGQPHLRPPGRGYSEEAEDDEDHGSTGSATAAAVTPSPPSTTGGRPSPSASSSSSSWSSRALASNAPPPLVLDVRTNSDAMDDYRLALPQDSLRRVLRLAIVAFALDGAADPDAERGWCGPRRLDVDGWWCVDEQVLGCTVAASWANTEERKRMDWSLQPVVACRAYTALKHGALPALGPENVADVVNAYASGICGEPPTRLYLLYGAVEDADCIAFARQFASTITSLAICFDNKKGIQVSERAANFIKLFKHVTELSLSFLHGGISDDGGNEFDDDPLVRLFDVIVAGGAPVEQLTVDKISKPCALAGLLNYLPTVTAVEFNATGDSDKFARDMSFALSDTVRGRLTTFSMMYGGVPAIACSAGFTKLKQLDIDTKDVFPRVGATWLDESSGPRDSLEKLGVRIFHPLPQNTNFGALFRNVTSLTIECWIGAIRLENVVPGLPRGLRKLRLSNLTHFTEWLTESLLLSSSSKPPEEEYDETDPSSSSPPPTREVIQLEEAFMDNVDDMSGLFPVAGSLRVLKVHETYHSPGPTPRVAELVHMCASQLIELHVPRPSDLVVPGGTSGASHSSADGAGQVMEFPLLRRVVVKNNESSPGALQRVLQASPRLHHVEGCKVEPPPCPASVTNGGREYPPWHENRQGIGHVTYEQNCVTLTRRSYCNES